MGKTKIDWCDYTVNPVVGCKNHCLYCYARKINDRFKFTEYFNEPQFFPERLRQIDKLHNKIIFMDSMSDIAYWPFEAFVETMEYINNHPDNKYLFLTKSPYLLRIKDRTNNKWFGISITCNRDKEKILEFGSNNYVWNKFLSVEPLLDWIRFYDNDLSSIGWVIIGAETGNRKNKVIPNKVWIDDIVHQCKRRNIPVFMKSSLKDIMGNDFIQEWPKELVK
jgi:protein gp37